MNDIAKQIVRSAIGGFVGAVILIGMLHIEKKMRQKEIKETTETVQKEEETPAE